jgi:glycosyltransferase involved in cell wall biosynthesis
MGAHDDGRIRHVITDDPPPLRSLETCPSLADCAAARLGGRLLGDHEETLTAVRILVVTPTVPWPARSGLQIRIVSTVRALADIGDVDLFSLAPDGRFGMRSIPEGEPAESWQAGRVTLRRRSTATRARLMLGSQPRVVAIRDHAVARHELARRARYDLVWFCRAESLIAVAPVLDAPFVVDLDDLEAVKIRGACRLVDRDRTGPGAALRRRTETLAMRWDARRWERMQREAVDTARVAVVASDEDRARLGIGGVAVVPNMYPAPDVAVGRTAVARQPVISFVGLLTYPPNVDAVRQLAHEIVPRVHREDASVQFRVIGRHDEDLARDCPELSFAGEVDAVAPELALTDVVAVPLRFGSGTRVKILEAFAHRLPVVSTRAGADGLDVRDGEHLLLADEPDAFARACTRLLRDRGLREHLTESAHRLWREQYGLTAFQRHVDDVVRRAVTQLSHAEHPSCESESVGHGARSSREAGTGSRA